MDVFRGVYSEGGVRSLYRGVGMVIPFTCRIIINCSRTWKFQISSLSDVSSLDPGTTFFNYFWNSGLI